MVSGEAESRERPGRAIAIDGNVPDVLRPYLDDPKVRRAFEERTMSIAVGRFVREAREARALTLNELAQQAGTMESKLARIEEGCALGEPSIDLLARIARALGMSLTIEFNREGQAEHALQINLLQPQPGTED